jgi:hypothetical protein
MNAAQLAQILDLLEVGVLFGAFCSASLRGAPTSPTNTVEPRLAQSFWAFATDETVGAVLCNFVLDNHIHNL